MAVQVPFSAWEWLWAPLSPWDAHCGAALRESTAGDPPLQLCVQAVCAALLQSWCAQTLLLLSFGLFLFFFFFFAFAFFLFSSFPVSSPPPKRRINYRECEQIVVVAREAVM